MALLHLKRSGFCGATERNTLEEDGADGPLRMESMASTIAPEPPPLVLLLNNGCPGANHCDTVPVLLYLLRSRWKPTRSTHPLPPRGIHLRAAMACKAVVNTPGGLRVFCRLPPFPLATLISNEPITTAYHLVNIPIIRVSRDALSPLYCFPVIIFISVPNKLSSRIIGPNNFFQAQCSPHIAKKAF